jgi:phage-related protein
MPRLTGSEERVTEGRSLSRKDVWIEEHWVLADYLDFPRGVLSKLTTINLSDTRDTRPVSWIRAAEKDFLKFPDAVQRRGRMSLTILAEGQKADNAKSLTGFDPGVQEIVLKDASGTYRVVYALKIDEEIWVLHAFKKKSKTGSKTPKSEIDVVRTRLKRLRELLR